MVKILLICIGRLDRVMFAPACAEYEKRLSRFCDLTIRELPEGTPPKNAGDIPRTLAMEAEKILALLAPGDNVTALCIEGKQLTSEELALRIGESMQTAARLVFIIGSSHGLDPRVVQRANRTLSMSKMTFPHQLARVMLLEQTYRAFTILGGQTYHK